MFFIFYGIEKHLSTQTPVLSSKAWISSSISYNTTPEGATSHMRLDQVSSSRPYDKTTEQATSHTTLRELSTHQPHISRLYNIEAIFLACLVMIILLVLCLYIIRKKYKNRNQRHDIQLTAYSTVETHF